jgi:hypothetical protein
MGHRDHWCYHCFFPLNTLSFRGRNLVALQCQGCGSQGNKTYYHSKCWYEIEQCHLCAHTTTKSKISVPQLPKWITRRRTAVVKPVSFVDAIPVPGPFSSWNPLHLLLRFLWVIFLPAKAQRYAEKHGTKNPEGLDWAITSVGMLIIGLAFTFYSIQFNEYKLEYSTYTALGLLAFFFVLSRIGATGQPLFNLLSGLLLAVTGSIILYSIVLSLPVVLLILNEIISLLGYNKFSFRQITFYSFVPTTIYSTILLTAGVIAYAPQENNIRSSKLYTLGLVPVGIGIALVWWDPTLQSKITEFLGEYLLFWFIALIAFGFRKQYLRLLFIGAVFLLHNFEIPYLEAPFTTFLQTALMDIIFFPLKFIIAG